MEDRFKYKVLDTTNNKFYNSLEDLSKEEENAHFLLTQDGAIIKKYYNNGEIQLIRMPQYKPVFCSGLRDKNNKLIYEGDIVKIFEYFRGVQYEMPAKIIFENCSFMLDGWFTSRGHTCINRNYFLADFAVDNICPFEVIGNAYENPELIED